jgi:hypothetical protein
MAASPRLTHTIAIRQIEKLSQQIPTDHQLLTAIDPTA